jgi:hypothetical protein
LSDSIDYDPFRADVTRCPPGLYYAAVYQVDLAGAERLRAEFVQGFSSLPIRLRP